MYPLQIFRFGPFNYRAVNQQFGLPKLKHHGLKSLLEPFQTHLQTGFDVYAQAHLMYQPVQSPKQKWSQQRAKFKAKKKPSLAELRVQVKTLQKAGKELAVDNTLMVREQVSGSFSSEKMWAALERLCSQNGEQKKQYTMLNQQVGSIVQFINFSSDALLFVTQEILPNIYMAVNSALCELREKKGKVDANFYKAYETYLIGLSEQLLGDSTETNLSEIGKLQENMYARLTCFAIYGHDDVLAQCHHEFKKIKAVSSLPMVHAQIPAASKMNRQAFEEFHRIIAFFGREEGKEKLKAFPWFQSQATEGMIPMENIMTDNGCWLIPTEFVKFIPKETSIPEWLFLGTTLRYWFFREQFYELARLNTSLAEIKQTLEQEKMSHDSFLKAHNHVKSAQSIIQSLRSYAKNSRLGWFARLFFGDTDKLIKQWQSRLSATAQELDTWQLELNEQFAKQESNLLLSGLTAHKHEAVQGILEQVSQYQTVSELQSRAQLAQSTYSDKTNILGQFLPKLVKESVSQENERLVLPVPQEEISNTIAQCIRLTNNPKLQAALKTLGALLVGEFSFAESSIEAVEQQLQLLLEQAATVEVPLARLCEFIARTYLLPRIKDSASPGFIYAKRWAPQAVELWWQQHELAVTEFLIAMRKLFIEIPQEGKVIPLGQEIDLNINGSERKFTPKQLYTSIKQFYAMAHEFPQYQEELHGHVRAYLKTYSGQDNLYQSFILICADKSLYLDYSTKRLRFLLGKLGYRELAQDVTFTLNPPDAFFIKEWSSIIRQHLSSVKEWDPYLLELIEKLKDKTLAQDYRFMALAQKLKPQLKDAVNSYVFSEKESSKLLVDAYGEHNINELIKLMRSFIDGYVDNDSGLQIMECILSEEFITTYHCESLKRDFYTLKKRALLMKQLQEHQISVEKALQAEHYHEAVDPILSLYTRWKTASNPLEKQECLKVLQALFSQLGNHIRLQISKLNYQANIDLKAACLDKLPKDIPIHPDIAFLLVLCTHQEVAYLCWYDVRDRQRFLAKQHRNFKAFKKGIALSATDLETMSVYSRLWELESDVYESTRAKQMRQTHEATVGQLQQVYQHQMTRGPLAPMKSGELKSAQQPLHYLRVYQPSGLEINSQLQQLTELNLLWFLVDTQMTKETTEWQTLMFQWLNAVSPPEQQIYLPLFQKDNIVKSDVQQWFGLWMKVFTNQLMFHGVIQQSRLDTEKTSPFTTSFCLFKEMSQQKDKLELAQINRRLQEKYQAVMHALTLPAKLDAASQLCHEMSQLAISYQAHPIGKTLQAHIHKDGLLMKALNWLQTANTSLREEQQLVTEGQLETRRALNV